MNGEFSICMLNFFSVQKVSLLKNRINATAEENLHERVEEANA